MSSRKTFGLALIAWTAVSAASGRDMWRATPEEIERTPAWMVSHAQRPVDTNEVVVADVPRDMKLFLLVGQSNMAGRGSVSAEDAKPMARCLKLNRDGKWARASTPIHFDRATAGYGIANSFVRRYLAEHPTDTVGLIPCAVGGSLSVTWSPEDAPDPVGTNFRRALARAREAQKSGRIVGILWHQGEADIGSFGSDPQLKERYAARLAEMARVFRAELKCPDAPFLVGEIGTLPKDCTAMNPILAEAARRIPNAALVKASDLTGHMPDGIHFDTPSYTTLGIRYYEAWKRRVGAETSGKASSEQRAAFEGYRRAWAAERPRIEADIDANRKSPLTVRVVDGAGRPVSNAFVRVEQLTHDFRFGCSILALGQLGRDNAVYEESFAKLFNHATTTFCLGAIEPVEGEVRFAEGSREIWRRPPPDRVLAFCQPRGIACKGQPLLAGSWHPKWAKAMDEVGTKKLYADYFRRVAERYGESYQMFDVVNEAYCHTDFRLYEPETHYVDWAFAEAARHFPASCRLTVNEATPVNWWTFSPSRSSPRPNICGSRYHRMIARIVGQGIRLDGIGFQLHFFGVGGLKDAICGGGNDIRDWRENYGRFAEFGKPLYVTEITVPTVLPKGWTGDGEAVQAEVLANLYRFYFSLPAFAGVTYWNLYDGATFKMDGWDEGVTNAGLLDYAAREKPAYQALYQLINREWKTFARLRTGSDGTVSLRGFRGTYRIGARQGDEQVESETCLRADGATVELRMK